MSAEPAATSERVTQQPLAKRNAYHVRLWSQTLITAGWEEPADRVLQTALWTIANDRKRFRAGIASIARVAGKSESWVKHALPEMLRRQALRELVGVTRVVPGHDRVGTAEWDATPARDLLERLAAVKYDPDEPGEVREAKVARAAVEVGEKPTTRAMLRNLTSQLERRKKTPTEKPPEAPRPDPVKLATKALTEALERLQTRHAERCEREGVGAAEARRVWQDVLTGFVVHGYEEAEAAPLDSLQENDGAENQDVEPQEVVDEQSAESALCREAEPDAARTYSVGIHTGVEDPAGETGVTASDCPTVGQHTPPEILEPVSIAGAVPEDGRLLVEKIPQAMRDAARWVVWRYGRGTGKPRKVPFQPASPHDGASSTDPEHWATFAEALALYKRGGFSGLEFALGDGWAGTDLDDVVDPEAATLAGAAANVLERVDSYTEVSPSKRGVKAVWYGALPEKGGRKRGAFETYDRERFFTITGWRLDAYSPDVEQRTEVHAEIHREVWPEQYAPPRAPRPASSEVLELSDAEILERAPKMRNGSGALFSRLYDGDSADYVTATKPEGDLSSADGAFLHLLAFWTSSADQMDRIFRGSHRMRDKWDEPRGRSTWGADEIAKALSRVTTHYTGRPA